MYHALRDAIVAEVRKHDQEGDCPTERSYNVETLENVVLAFAGYTAPVFSGWANTTLASAYMAIEQLKLGLNQDPESGIAEALTRALDAIEAADCEFPAAPLSGSVVK